MPNVYSVMRQSNVVSSSKINSLFSPEAFIRNEEYGDLKNITLGKNFLFEWRNFDFQKGVYVDLMNVWNVYLTKKWVAIVGFGIFSLSILGLIMSLVKRERVGIGVFSVFGYSLFFLLNTNLFYL